MTQEITLSFEKITAVDLPKVGGKGANLGEMNRAGFPVPAGFCVTTAGFGEFIAGAEKADYYYDALEQLAADDVAGVRTVGEDLRTYLSSVEIPGTVNEALVAAWKAEGTEHFYAVRSSATAEDLPTASFAGQQDTYLNIHGEENLLEAVRNCWVSLFTDRAILYRAQNGFPHRQVQLSVVVQRMVLPEVSGILFTADPISGHRKIISIDASYGLGEALVAGLVSADLYKVDKRDWRIVETNIADKRLAIWPKPEGGTYQEAPGDELAGAQVLKEEQITALAKIGAKIESHYGKPQDIEWAIENDKIYIVQSRPITALFPIPSPPPQEDTLRLYISLSHAQVMTDPMSPMGISIWKLLLPFGRHKGIEYNPYLSSAGGRMYMDISPLLFAKIPRRIIPRVLTVADEIIAKSAGEFVQREDFLESANRSKDKASPHHTGRLLVKVFLKGMRLVWFKSPEGSTEKLNEHIDSVIANIQKNLQAKESGLPKIRQAHEELATIFMKSAMPFVPYIMGMMVSKTILEQLVEEKTQSEDVFSIMRGLEGNVTTDMDLKVGDLADVVRKTPALVEALNNQTPQEVWNNFESLAGGTPFETALEEFMSKYGMRGTSEIDIARPRWKDDPSFILQVVAGTLQHHEAGVHRKQHQALVEEGKAAGERLAKNAKRGIFGAVRSRLVKRLVRVFRNLMPVREHPKYMLVQAFQVVRDILLEIGESMVKAGRMDNVEDIWMLEFHEVEEALERPDIDIKPLIQQRKEEQERYWGITPPRVITSEGEIITTTITREDLPEGALAGSPVSAGVIEGVARVITDPTQEMLKPGEILVAPFTDPGWTPLFINAAGLVMEVGGLMTHGSVVAREYGIPAVVGVVDAVKEIQTGQKIRVDGTNGYVEFLDGVD